MAVVDGRCWEVRTGVALGGKCVWEGVWTMERRRDGAGLGVVGLDAAAWRGWVWWGYRVVDGR